ncbi:MAG: metal-dependent hydrolase, partial [Candidatus Kapabacteria bacterium]|nr:metal-dependent hydrolase [Candidatus Kapabacteria bacterium]
GVVCAVSALLPDVDSPTSKPTEFVLSITSALAPGLVIQNLPESFRTPSGIVVAVVVSYVAIRFLFRYVLKNICVHRGMFHSIPAALIWGGVLYVSFRSSPEMVRQLVAGSAIIGYIVHLAIDEMFSLVDINGGTFQAKSSSGTALKFFSSSSFANFVCYGLLAFVTYVCFAEGLPPMLVPPFK